MSRALTLPEELEKLEQSITLTLQEIDRNFSQAHRTVTQRILPVVEAYARHSADVWEGSKFWKHFFEASANVSLSGYEEAAIEEEDITQTDDTSATLRTPTGHEEEEEEEEGGAEGEEKHQQHQQSQVTPSGTGAEDDEEEFSVESPTQVTGLQTTPRLSADGAGKKPAFRSPSPRKYTGRNLLATAQPTTPRSAYNPTKTARPQSSPFEPDTDARRHARTNNDALLHRGVLDKNYRVQATPHTQPGNLPHHLHQQEKHDQATGIQQKRKTLWDDSPDSSPVAAVPQLRSDLFSPVLPTKAGPRTPGISVLTPAGARLGGGGARTTTTGRQLFSPQDKTYISQQQRHRTSHSIFASPNEDEDEDDDDMLPDISPPKTIPFHVPPSRLLQTPAREASRRIVEDLLLTAGAEGTEEIEAVGGDAGEASPSVVRRVLEEDDTF
ncbi:hypothetical protein M433DRAFT_387907 [Acidomyces richmondensis BFW]|nr:MAG: hypothetical protein FE78DRAFT_74140 [Acidomyces sp. 'richmondensis']KYG42829.1 hypothetical protein M433DRAFT_387907 [Acidomyces richmondensis BFW]